MWHCDAAMVWYLVIHWYVREKIQALFLKRMDLHMAMVQWNEEMSVGVAELDGHHKKLLSMINGLAVAIGHGKGKDHVSHSVSELVDYTEYHFNLEHEYFHQFGFVETEAHIKEHTAFVKKIKETSEKIKSGKVLLSINILYFLKDWLVNHIMVVDKKYAQLLKNKGIS